MAGQHGLVTVIVSPMLMYLCTGTIDELMVWNRELAVSGMRFPRKLASLVLDSLLWNALQTPRPLHSGRPAQRVCVHTLPYPMEGYCTTAAVSI
jgi:hypothetical protein